MATLIRVLPLLAAALLAGCLGSEQDRPLCVAAEDGSCEECFTGVIRCSFGWVQATEVSCGDCQARFALFHKLCEAGSTATVEHVDEGMVCEVVDTGS